MKNPRTFGSSESSAYKSARRSGRGIGGCFGAAAAERLVVRAFFLVFAVIDPGEKSRSDLSPVGSRRAVLACRRSPFLRARLSYSSGRLTAAVHSELFENAVHVVLYRGDFNVEA